MSNPSQDLQKPVVVGVKSSFAQVVEAAKKAASSNEYAGKVVAILSGSINSSTDSYLQRKGSGDDADYALFGWVAGFGAEPMAQDLQELSTLSGHSVEYLISLPTPDLFSIMVENEMYELPMVPQDLKGTTLQVPDEIQGLPRTGRAAASLDEYLVQNHGKSSMVLVAFDPEVTTRDLTFANGDRGTSVIIQNPVFIAAFNAPGRPGSLRTAEQRMEDNRANLQSSIQRRTSGPRSGYGGGINATITINTTKAATEAVPQNAPAGNLME